MNAAETTCVTTSDRVNFSVRLPSYPQLRSIYIHTCRPTSEYSKCTRTGQVCSSPAVHSASSMCMREFVFITLTEWVPISQTSAQKTRLLTDSVVFWSTETPRSSSCGLFRGCLTRLTLGAELFGTLLVCIRMSFCTKKWRSLHYSGEKWYAQA